MNWRRRNNGPSSANQCCSSPSHCLRDLALCNHDIWPWAGQGDITLIVSIAAYYTLILRNLSPGGNNQWIIQMSWPEFVYIDSYQPWFRTCAEPLCRGGGVTRVWAAYSWYQMLECAALQLQSHSNVDTESQQTGHLLTSRYQSNGWWDDILPTYEVVILSWTNK